MFGSHLSIAGGLTNALAEARALGLDTVQIFTKNQQQWKARPLADDAVHAWRSAVDSLGWKGPAGGVSHASYLINLASPDDALWEKSIEAMRDEIERCERLGLPFLVHHPGSFTTSTREAGIDRIARAYARLFRETPGFQVVSCLEGTAGGGNTLGGRFEDLAELRARILDATGEPLRLGFCLDTCHMHAAGYDMSSRAAADAALDLFDRLCGLAHVRVLHLNDSKGRLASRIDRHEHIGRGELTPRTLKDSGFAAVVNRPEFRRVPMILETPKGEDPRGVPFDTLNLRRLRGLADSPGVRGTLKGKSRHPARRGDT